ncbi:hypothetical protein E2C01_012022 [Portunus trituberculatus]|uniref:Uncharacterized protein n=1 Tax=Portunus trituberculatus TaxID=210409 RepID=A0A5B7DCX2_PORTR|nr:hypothetical protein [Portunus trituberculatus]
MSDTFCSRFYFNNKKERSRHVTKGRSKKREVKAVERQIFFRNEAAAQKACKGGVSWRCLVVTSKRERYGRKRQMEGVVTYAGSLDPGLCHPDIHPQASVAGMPESTSYLDIP